MKQITALLFSWMLILPAIAQNVSKEYKFSREWKADGGTIFELVAKYQTFRIEFWDKDIVRIDFNMSTTDSKIQEEDFKEALQVSGDRMGNKLTISTSMNDLSSNSIWEWIFGSKKSKESYKVNNIVYLPRNLVSLDLNFNYCDIKMGAINLPAKIKSNYSTLFIQKSNKHTIINSSYTDIQLGEMSYVKINSSYSDLIFNVIDTLNLGSSYDDIKLSNCGVLQSLTLSYSDAKIEKAGYIKATCTYSDLKVNSLTQELHGTLTYSDLKINDIARNFSGINITGTYSDCLIKINPENPVNLSITDVNGDIDLKNTRLNITKRQEVSVTTNLTAKTKNATDASPFIKLNSNSCDLKIY